MSQDSEDSGDDSTVRSVLWGLLVTVGLAVGIVALGAVLLAGFCALG